MVGVDLAVSPLERLLLDFLVGEGVTAEALRLANLWTLVEAWGAGTKLSTEEGMEEEATAVKMVAATAFLFLVLLCDPDDLK